MNPKCKGQRLFCSLIVCALFKRIFQLKDDFCFLTSAALIISFFADSILAGVIVFADINFWIDSGTSSLNDWYISSTSVNSSIASILVIKEEISISVKDSKKYLLIIILSKKSLPNFLATSKELLLLILENKQESLIEIFNKLFNIFL